MSQPHLHTQRQKRMYILSFSRSAWQMQTLSLLAWKMSSAVLTLTLCFSGYKGLIAFLIFGLPKCVWICYTLRLKLQETVAASGDGQLLWCRCITRLLHGRSHIVIHLRISAQYWLALRWIRLKKTHVWSLEYLYLPHPPTSLWKYWHSASCPFQKLPTELMDCNGTLSHDTLPQKSGSSRLYPGVATLPGHCASQKSCGQSWDENMCNANLCFPGYPPAILQMHTSTLDWFPQLISSKANKT